MTNCSLIDKKHLLSFSVLFIISFIPCSLPAQFSIDSSYIKKFDKRNDVEIYTGVTKTSFRFRKLTNDNYISRHKLFANTSAYTVSQLTITGYHLATPGIFLTLRLPNKALQ